MFLVSSCVFVLGNIDNYQSFIEHNIHQDPIKPEDLDTRLNRDMLSIEYVLEEVVVRSLLERDLSKESQHLKVSNN